jgi:hypothetical protein
MRAAVDSGHRDTNRQKVNTEGDTLSRPLPLLPSLVEDNAQTNQLTAPTALQYV